MTRTLGDTLSEVPEPDGRKIGLPSIPSLSVAAMLSGADRLMAIFRWAGGCGLKP